MLSVTHYVGQYLLGGKETLPLLVLYPVVSLVDGNDCGILLVEDGDGVTGLDPTMASSFSGITFCAGMGRRCSRFLLRDPSGVETR